jgi:hypothetical protein
MNDTNKPSGEGVDVLAVMDETDIMLRTAFIDVHPSKREWFDEKATSFCKARAAVAALIAHNAEIEADRELRRDVCERLGFDCAQGAEWAAEDIWGVLLKEVERSNTLAADNLALREDAQRYRCLRDGEWNKALPNGRIGMITGNFGEDLDAAIDDARTSAATGGGPQAHAFDEESEDLGAL